MVLEVAWLCEQLGFPPVVITRICTSQEEVVSIYGADRFTWHKADKDGYSRAIDFRSRCYSSAEQDIIEAHLSKHFPWAETLKHDVGRADHFHVAAPGVFSIIKRLRRLVARWRAAK